MSGALGLNWQDAACQVKSQKKSDNMDTVRARECKQKTKRFDIILLNGKGFLICVFIVEFVSLIGLKVVSAE